MTAAALEPTAATLDVSGTPRIPLTRLVLVELRKLADTRSGKWLLIAIGVITLLIVTAVFLTAKPSDRTFLNFMGATATPQGFLLPVLGILLVTSEWNQRTALVTFTLMPLRGKVVVAKVIAALLAGLAAIVLAVALGRPGDRGRRRHRRVVEHRPRRLRQVRGAAGHRRAAGPGLRPAVPQLRRGDRRVLRGAHRVLHPRRTCGAR